MKKILFCIAFLSIAYSFVWGGISSNDFQNKDTIYIEAIVKQIGPPPERDSGNIDVYQLIKYEITRVLEGKYNEKEIVVDHLILSPDQLKELRVGDKVCLSVTKRKSISFRYDVDGIRNASDSVKYFYISNGNRSVKLCNKS